MFSDFWTNAELRTGLVQVQKVKTRGRFVLQIRHSTARTVWVQTKTSLCHPSFNVTYISTAGLLVCAHCLKCFHFPQGDCYKSWSRGPDGVLIYQNQQEITGCNKHGCMARLAATFQSKHPTFSCLLWDHCLGHFSCFRTTEAQRIQKSNHLCRYSSLITLTPLYFVFCMFFFFTAWKPEAALCVSQTKHLTSPSRVLYFSRCCRSI